MSTSESTTLGVIPFPGLELEQPSAGATDNNDHQRSSSTNPRFTTNVYPEPQPLRFYYYDPRRSSSQSMLPPPFPMLGPSPADPMLALRALQSQFATFQESLGNVNADVKDALSQLHALRTAQNKMDKRIAELQDMIGVTSTGTRAGACGRRSRARGGKAGTHVELDVDSAVVPEKTLVQTVALIQSAVEALLARDNLSPNPRETAASIPSCPPSTNLTGQELFIDPSPQLSILHSVSAISSTSQSDSSSPLSSIAIPTHTPTGKEYVDASIQACSPSPTLESSCSSSYSRNHTPGFVPVDWSVDAVRPTEHSAHFLRDTRIPSSTNTETDSQTSQRDNDDSLRSSTASNPHLPTHVMSFHATSPVVPLTSSATQNLSLQTLPLTTEAINSPLRMGSSGDLPMSPTLPLSTLTSFGDMPISASGTPESIPAACRHTNPVVANDEGLPSGLPTPPSDAFVDDREARVASRLTREQVAATDQRLVSCTHLARNFPIIPTTPALTPEPSVQGDGGICQGSVRQDSLGVDSGSLSSLMPPLLSSCSAVGSSQSEGGVRNVNRRVVAHKVAEEHTNPLDVAGPTVVSQGDATEVVAVDAKESDSRVPGITVTQEPPRAIAVSNNDSSPPPDADLFATPKPSARQPNHGLREHHPDSDGISPRYSQMDGYDFIFSSPLRHPSPPSSSTPSRYATPSGSSNSGPTPEEDEVWGALMRDGSGISTPTLVHPSLSRGASVPPSSEQFSASAPEPLAVDPAMLHDPLPLPSRGAELQHSQPGLNSPLSSLTSLDEMSVTRAASEADMEGGAESRSVGGPSASLSELALLARREPLKIRLRLPKRMRNLKRKRDASDGDGEDRAEKDDGVLENVSPCRHGAMRSGSDTPKQTVAQLASESSPSRTAVDAGEHPNLTSRLSVPRKKTKKRGEYDGEDVRVTRTAPTHASVRQKQGSKRGSKGKPRPPVKYHLWNGQIVSVELEPEPELTPTLGPQPQPQPQPGTLTTSPVSQPAFHAEEVDQKVQPPARPRHRKGHGNEAREVPLSSSPGRLISRIPRTAKSSSPEEDEWNMICQDGRKWPELPETFSNWDLQFIECDNCDKWYHYGCVAIGTGDPRLEPETLFICPTCHIQSARRLTLRHQDDTCARPDCPEPQVTSDTEMYYVEKLVGRKTMEGYVFMWLAKWEGYPMSQATWIPKENVVGDGTRMFNAFMEDAMEEGADLDQDVVLLREALDAGWTGDELD